jgi:integrase
VSAIVPLRAERAVRQSNELELLRAALDPLVLEGLGWDPERLSLSPPPEHLSLGYRVCEVVGCEGWGAHKNALCGVCNRRWKKRQTGDDPITLDAFKALARPNQRRREPNEPIPLCRVCCVPPDHLRVVETQGLCKAHNQQRVYYQVTADELVKRDDVVPLKGYGDCARDGCERIACGPKRLCIRCESEWRQKRNGLELHDFYNVYLFRPSPGAPISLANLTERVRLELLYVAQRFTQLHRRAGRLGFVVLVREARENGVESLLDLPTLTPPTWYGSIAQRVGVRELDVLYADPDEEYARDVWDVRKLGVAHQRCATLDFTGIGQPWLREGAKEWARVKSMTSTMAALRATLVVVRLLSESLARRADRGDEKTVLNRADMRQFVERLGRLHRAGRVFDSLFYRGPGTIRQFMREGREFGLYEPGRPLHGLTAGFAIYPEDIPERIRDLDADGEGRALPQVVIDQLLSQEYLAMLRAQAGEDVCAMLQLEADTGRRPSELAALTATCLTSTEYIDEDTGRLERSWVLIHDMPKVKVKNYRLFIAESTAQLLIAQRDRVQARYPATPLTRLSLFPRTHRNPHGVIPAGEGRLHAAVRSWVDSLPRLVGASGEDFPRERVFPYAFRHSFAQRHADNGTPLDVLCSMMGHGSTDTTRGYYKVNKSRMRKAVAVVSEMQLTHRGTRVPADFGTLVDAEVHRYQVGQVAVPFGVCNEPSNVKSNGQGCPYKFRCFGCAYFRTDPSYLPELHSHLRRLLADHERLNAITDGMLEEWARRDAAPPPDEIVAVRRLIRAAEKMLGELSDAERASVDELMAILRRARANIDSALPIHMHGRVRQPQPLLHPLPATGGDR